MGLVILTLLIILIVLLLVLLSSAKKFINAIGFDSFSEFIKAIKEGMNSSKDIYSSPKNLSDMTKMLVPLITNDFPSFNKDQLFTLTRTNINEILDALESKNADKVKNKSLSFIKPKVQDEINNLIELEKEVKFTNVQFNKCAISAYSSLGGAAKITVVVSLNYYYDTNDKKDKKYKDVKKETRYKLEYVYIYDEEKIPVGTDFLKINCPNCGAPADFYGKGKCSYCNTYLTPINIKNWSVIDYEEY